MRFRLRIIAAFSAWLLFAAAVAAAQESERELPDAERLVRSYHYEGVPRSARAAQELFPGSRPDPPAAAHVCHLGIIF